jgi:hypothetical protein
MRAQFRVSAVVMFLLATARFNCGADFKIEWKEQRVEVSLPSEHAAALSKTNWTTQQWQALLSVIADQGDLLTSPTLPAMAGAYRVEGNVLRFEPQFPLEPEVTYRALFRPQKLGATNSLLSATRRIAAPARNSSTIITAIYPSAATLPENLLKFYVHFSAPMSGGHVYDYIQLIDMANSKPVELPFLEIDEELWSRDMTRLTLFLDPGRIKRGVRPLEEIGPSFQAGKTYTLVISTNWQDATGAPLKAGFQKKFSVTPPDRTTPDPKLWKISAPATRTAPLEVQFEKPLDHAIIEHRLAVLDSDGKTVAGKIEIADEERHWRFAPQNPWKAGTYQLRVPTLIEDIAGNNIGKPFDLDLLEERQPTGSEYVKLTFEVK